SIDPGIKVHDFKEGDWIYVKNWKTGDKLEPKWEGPYQVLLTTTFALKIAEKDSWIHHAHVKRAPPNFTSQDTETCQHPDTSLKFISEQQY
uniref:Murine leukemia virus integrase C-terminal domain-containing protein n=1 Tax=Pelusios castaneus TaxID=367368 RepID=A0A8C8RLL6_9SAUR